MPQRPPGAPAPDEDALVRCPGCGRQTMGTIARCTYCRVELGLQATPPSAGPSSRAVERCALCGESYDGRAHDACPHCAERFGTKRQKVLDRHHQGRRLRDLGIWLVGAAVVTGLGLLAEAGALWVAPTLDAGRGLWLGAAGGGLAMGLLAGWRLRARSVGESVVAVIGIAVATTFWLRAAVIWANGFNLEGEAVAHRCEVVARQGGRTTLRCTKEGGRGETSGDLALPEEAMAEASGAALRIDLQRGRLGYWVADLGSARPVEADGVEG